MFCSIGTCVLLHSLYKQIVKDITMVVHNLLVKCVFDIASHAALKSVEHRTVTFEFNIQKHRFYYYEYNQQQEQSHMLNRACYLIDY